jgi:anti-anti-sigma factor
MNIILKGQLNYLDMAKFSTILPGIKTAKFSECVVDLSNLNSMDSTGLRILLLIIELCRSNGANLVFRKASGQVAELLMHSKFDTIVRLEE